MANISNITITNGVTYNIVDDEAARANNVYTKTQVDGKIDALEAGDIGYSDSSAYASGTVGYKIKAINDLLAGLELVDDKPY